MYTKKYGNYYSNLSDTIFIPQKISRLRTRKSSKESKVSK